MADKDSFADLFGTARSLKNDKIKPSKSHKKLKIKNPRQQTEIEIPEKTIAEPCRNLTADDSLFFSRSGIQTKQLRKFRQGKMPIEAELDLHGATQKQARELLDQFIAECLACDYRTVRIIHGRGHGSSEAIPVLKNLVNNELPSYPDILAYCSAQARDGGLGAVYVLLKAQVK